jgi:hypothetical protein
MSAPLPPPPPKGAGRESRRDPHAYQAISFGKTTVADGAKAFVAKAKSILQRA